MAELHELTPALVPELHRLIVQMAHEEGYPDAVETTPEILTQDAFGDRAHFEAFLVQIGPDFVGFCLYFPMYSGWKGQKTLYVEDLYVLPEYRGNGAGTALTKKLQEIASRHKMNLAWEVNRDEIEKRQYFVSKGAVDRSHKVSFFTSSIG